MSGVTPHGIRYPDGASKAKNLGPELQLMAEDIDGVLTDPDGIIHDVAEIAVDDALAAEDIIIGSNERSMKYGVPYAWRVRDADGKIALGVTEDGRARVDDMSSRRAQIAGMTFTESDDGGVAFKDAAGKVAFRIGADGRTLIGDLHPDSHIAGTAGGGARMNRVLCLVAAGQSNAVGRGLPIGPRLDPTHPRILMSQWSGATVTGLTTATVPISSQQMIPTAGLDPSTVIARQIVAEQEDTVVVICNTARGGSGLVFDTANGVWDTEYAGSNTHLFPISLAAITKTLDEIAVRFPGLPVDIQFVWHQGESDGGIAYATYLDALERLFTAFRTYVGDSTAPFVMGGTVPEDSNPTEEANIMAAQIAAQGTLQHTAFAPGVANGGGSSAPSGDTVHYHRAGMEQLGKRMHTALRRAYVNAAASIPTPPLTVSARWRKSIGTLDIEWAFPFCRATAFTVQYSVDGGGWQTVTGRPRELDPVATVTGLTTGNEIRVRVATTNEGGSSAYTTPITAIGA